MQLINMIGTVIRPPEEFESRGTKMFYFVVRAENSPPSDKLSAFDFNVVSTNFVLKEKLRVGTNLFVDGLQKIEYVEKDKTRVRVTIKASYIKIIEGSRLSPDIKSVASSIPLDTTNPK